MKVIFLDFDFVLNSRKSFAFHTLTQNKRHAASPDIYSVTLLDYLLFLIPELKVVVSSSWRSFEGVEQTKLDVKNEFGLKHWDRVIGQTGFDRKRHRGTEIQTWLSHNKVDQYAIIDDDSDFLIHQKPFHIHTDQNGFSPEHFDQIATLFGVNPLNIWMDENVKPFREYYKIMEERKVYDR